MDTFNRITKLQMIIPAEQIPIMLDRLVQEFPLKEQYDEILGSRGSMEALIWLLGMLGWNAVDLPDGRVKITEFTGEVLDQENNLVIKSAIGIVLPGSFIEGYSEENQQWQLRYHLSHTTIVQGAATFPHDPTWESLTRTFTVIRDAYPIDQQQLELFIHRPLNWAEGHILVVEHANGIRAFLQYHFHERIEQTAIVTRIVTHPLGRSYGYRQSLVKALQQRYKRVLIEHPSSSHKREWRKLGFLEINKEEKTKFSCSIDTFLWTKGPMQDGDRSQREKAEGALRRFLADHFVLWQALSLNYASLHTREMQLPGRWFLVPDGIGSWKPAQTDVHPLALPLPEISQEEYERFGGKRENPSDDVLKKYREAILDTWSNVGFMADDPSYPFWNPTATSF